MHTIRNVDVTCLHTRTMSFVCSIAADTESPRPDRRIVTVLLAAPSEKNIVEAHSTSVHQALRDTS